MFFIITSLISCEDYYNRRVVFTLEGIVADRTTIGQGESVNLSANIDISGMVNENDVKYTWDCTDGIFSDRTRQVTVWTAPSDYTGEFMIRLKVSFMGNNEDGEIAVKVVRTPAGGWGSVSGNIYNYLKVPLRNVIVATKTGESDTTDTEGFFYIEDIPQGTTGLEFSNVGFKWAAGLPDGIGITGGIHEHLGDIILYESNPPELINYEEIPEYHSIISIRHEFADVFKYIEVYISESQDGSDSLLALIIPSGTTLFTIKEEKDSAFMAMKAIPYHGEASNFSAWTKIGFREVIDPDASKSSIEYVNFFNASLTWEPTGYENYYKGFRIAEENDTGFAFISHLLSATTFQYDLETFPGMIKNYYVIAITNNDKFNRVQPSEHRIGLQVPAMEFPSFFNGKFQFIDGIAVKLTWEPVASNNAWYSGYLIEKKKISGMQVNSWEELTRIGESFTASFTDTNVDTSGIYMYKIQTVTYPPGPGNPQYSIPDSITIEYN